LISQSRGLGDVYKRQRLARAYGWEYIAVSSAPELKAALKIKGRVVIEVPVAG
jgi:thiamine pyrophosphate-dependent acetolactate synthase large subunit-like protein